MTSTPEIARPLSEWHEDMGDVLWWRFPILEAPYVGSPLDEGRSCQITLRLIGEKHTKYVSIGGWLGYHSHWTPLPPCPVNPSPNRPVVPEERSDGEG